MTISSHVKDEGHNLSGMLTSSHAASYPRPATQIATLRASHKDAVSITKTTSGSTSVEIAPLDSLEPIEAVQLYHEISRRLVDQIRSGKWRPGHRLPSERDLARSLNVSRPSLREALAALQLRGVLATRQGAATRVTEGALAIVGVAEGSDSDTEVEDVSPVALLEAREALESTTARLAASRFEADSELDRYLDLMSGGRDGDPVDAAAWCDADRLFHRRIAMHTGNPVLMQFAAYVSTAMDQPLWRELRDEMLAVPGRIESSIAEHQRILDSLRRGQSVSAAAHAREHVQAVRTYMGLDPT